RVPADLRLLSASELQADESTLTGESLPVEKAVGAALAPDTPLAERATMLFAGSTLHRGRCQAMVVEPAPIPSSGRSPARCSRPRRRRR
ncbi:MAG: hypothetical protein R3184_12150, partial [Aurantimonas coralicida]|nr:hypothetical protein [Aurantimonas coralicida]